MDFSVTLRLLGILLMLFSLSQLPPAAVSLFYDDLTFGAFLAAFAITFVTGFVVWYPLRRNRAELRIRDSFLLVTLFWLVLGSFGSIPFMLVEALSMSFTDAIFESISGLTTTGATVISGLDDLPRAILYYRQQLQWLGGLGIIAIAVAILPMLASWVEKPPMATVEKLWPMASNRLMPARK